MSNKKTWREKLEEIGGYENEMVSVPAGAVREMIDEMEALEADLKKANARERRAFQAGLYEDIAESVDEEQLWQQYRCQDDTDWKVVKPPEDNQEISG